MSDDEYNRLLKQFAEKVRGALTWRTYFQRLLNAGRRTGRSDLEIGDDIRREYRGEIPDVTLRKSLPNSFKHQEFTNKPKAIKIIASEPEIPPPPEVVREAQIVRQPPKAIDHPITIPTPKPYIIFRQKQWRDKYNWDTSHTLKLVLDNTRENIIDVRPMMEAKK